MDTVMQKVYKHFANGGELSSNDALSLYGAARLSGIVHRLKKRGCEFRVVMRNSRNLNPITGFGRYAVYTMTKGISVDCKQKQTSDEKA